MTKPRVLLVDDEPSIRSAIRMYLENRECDVEEADNLGEAEEALRSMPADVAVIDYMLPDGNALDALPRFRAIDPQLPMVILTGHGSIDLAVRAIKEGAEQFLTKPVELSVLWVVLERVLDNNRLRRKQQVQNSAASRSTTSPFLGTSRAIQRLAAEAATIARANSPVLITGETGTGKGVLARWIHDNSPRVDEAFVEINCAGLRHDFLESELFGHEKGAFTGAIARKQGMLEVAHRGTVFLDEIGDVNPQIQPKLLKVLEEKRFRPLGQVRDRQVDIRLVAATHQDLLAIQQSSRFRSDLYFRISTVCLEVPALRERREDIPEIARMLLQGLASDIRRPPMRLSPAAEERLQKAAWPGNIRELRNVIERAALFSRDDVIGEHELRFDLAAGTSEPTSQWTLDQIEEHHIRRVLLEEDGHVEKSAERLGIGRSSLYNRIKRYGLEKS